MVAVTASAPVPAVPASAVGSSAVLRETVLNTFLIAAFSMVGSPGSSGLARSALPVVTIVPGGARSGPGGSGHPSRMTDVMALVMAHDDRLMKHLLKQSASRLIMITPFE
ncbi:hypothetical protein OG455_25210 [Kitasatospora sp. NBC_01287]|uniref:hypothetical protein n=1 Tax=Kitasatospora sp. NBC_01287 TaxID=2903573 RepID=UPI0022591D85|nr:hypothetical protein [Kitasatospora sp. NBC_01287]MCX4748775.1 hypothetical protein [Kitasatospora sp. NBC_01287]